MSSNPDDVLGDIDEAVAAWEWYSHDCARWSPTGDHQDPEVYDDDETWAIYWAPTAGSGTNVQSWRVLGTTTDGGQFRGVHADLNMVVEGHMEWTQEPVRGSVDFTLARNEAAMWEAITRDFNEQIGRPGQGVIHWPGTHQGPTGEQVQAFREAMDALTRRTIAEREAGGWLTSDTLEAVRVAVDQVAREPRRSGVDAQRSPYGPQQRVRHGHRR